MRPRVQRRPYLVTVHPEGRWWHIQVPDLGPGAVSQARDLREVESQARDLIAVWLDVAPNRIRLIIKRRRGLRPMWSEHLTDRYFRS